MKKRLLSLLLAAAMVLSMLPAVAFAADSAADSFTNPFTSGTLNSTSWRIPAMVTLDNGTIVAAADARWNTTYDGGGLDTAVAYSTDNGATWTKSLENYLDDNGSSTTDVYNYNYTCFIDPALATDGSIVWMLCDLYPYGIAINGNGSQAAPYSGSTGFNDDGYLLLAKSSSRATSTSAYKYYLNGSTIYSSDGTAVEGLTVDAYFNVTGTYNGSTVNSNLFFSDSPFKVYPTGYLYLKSSPDGGETWSYPTLLNLKTSSEKVCLVGPGRGLVTSNGNVIFPVYSYNGSTETQALSFLSMDGQTGTWSRSTSLSFSNLDYTWSSESAVVELTDGTLRFFFRNDNSAICYADYNNGWKNPVNTGVASNSDTQMSAISYSKTIDGKQVILLSCPTGPNGNGTNDNNGAYRTSGKLHVFTVDASTGAMTLQKKINITNVATGALSGSTYTESQGFFAYSCLTELEDGSVAILYENNQNGWGSGSGYGYTITSAAYSEDELGVTFDSTTSGGGTETGKTSLTDTSTDVTVTTDQAVLTSVGVSAGNAVTNSDGTVSKTYAITVNGGAYTGAATVKVPYDSAFNGCTSFSGYMDDGADANDAVTVTLKDGYFVCDVLHFSDLTITGSSATTQTVTLKVGENFTVTDETGNYEDATTNVEPNANVATMVVDGTTVAGGTTEALTEVTSITSGSAYYISDGNGNFLTLSNGALTNVTNVADATKWTVTYFDTPSWGNGASRYRVKSGNYYIQLSGGSLKATTETSNINHYFKANIGFYGSSDGSNAWIYNNGWTVGTAVDNSAKLYTLETVTTDPVAATEITFTGVAPGSTTAKVGNTTYNITVNAINDTAAASVMVNGTTTLDALALLGLGDGYSASYALTSGSSYATLSGSTVTGVAEGTATVTATIYYGNTVCGTVTYTVTVANRGGHQGDIVLTTGESTTRIIPDALNDGETVEWTSSNTSYVTATGSSATGTITAGSSAGSETYTVTATVKSSSGSAVATYTWTVLVTTDTVVDKVRHFYAEATLRDHCTIYYSINGGPLTELKEGEVIDRLTEGNEILDDEPFNIIMFAKPDEGYIVTYLGANVYRSGYEETVVHSWDNAYSTGNNWKKGVHDGQFYSIVDGGDSGVTASSAYATIGNRKAFYWAVVQGNFTEARFAELLEEAVELGCQGATTTTFNGYTWDKYYNTKDATTTTEGSSVSKAWDFQFVAQKLPEMTKKVTSITDKDGNTANYVEDSGTKLGIGDTVNYTITVYEPVADETYGTIEYSNINIQDPLTGGSWDYKGTAGTETTVTINGHTFTAIPYTYTTSLTLTTQNFTNVVNAGTITNVVTFSYSANSEYCTGSVSVGAEAGIHVSVDPAYVVDFGVPLDIDLTKLETDYGAIDKIKDPNGEEVTITDKKLRITTTDAQSFTDIMAYEVELADKDGEDQGGYYITIIPASNVLFEAETFMTTSGSGAAWSKGDNATVDAQDGSETDPYGYDGNYAGQVAGAYSAGLAYTASVSSKSPTTEDLTFTFTGTGFDLIGTCGPDTGTLLVRVDNKNGLYMSYMVDTSFEDENYGTIYQVPLIHAQDWPEDTYTVTIRGVYMGGDAVFGIDAFRVYRSTADQAYNDAERNAKYYNVLNETIHSADADGNKTIQAYTETSTDTEWKVTEYESNGGPQNEIYLAPGQAVAFKVENSADGDDDHNPLVHFSARALDGTSVSISTAGMTSRTGTVASGTEMYYAVTAGNDGIITIKNTNTSGMLALGNLKLTAALSDGSSDDGKEGENNTSPFSLLWSRSRSETSGIIYVGQAATLVPLTEEDQETVNALLSLNSSGDSENTDPDTGDADVNDSDSSGSTGSTGNDDVVILPAPDTSADAKDEPENETADGPESPYLNKDEAYAYITGFVDGTVRPMADITRAEVATIFYRMLKDEIRDQYWSNINDFTDVTSGDWYNTAVSTLASLGIVTGNPDGSFNPNGKITRAEFATMAVRFFVVTEEYDLDETVFSDISTSWAAENILLAYELGLVNGNPDGTFRPGNSITRAEAMTIVNNMLGRKPKVAGLPDEADMITWVDNADKSVWYYAGVQAATNSYTSVYSEEIGGDLWTGVTTVPNWSELEKIWAGKHTED